ncbi:haloacid dehalogenase-like hydrolase (HAD) superfamily protein [Actinidia rufa]|uniref:Haloacid dehalogenase-like hydrolase (HAD) superfamily protein n=1 Tax=Actinidia rufa TaxID=165716 RepID=A0A7J0E2S3_9ERIC|nr:haloacid dehalogenase-like hydrolase (HAD) superfamily protein [Actinidia rufa]
MSFSVMIQKLNKAKPSPDIFLAAAKRFEGGPVDPQNIFVFEDAPSGVGVQLKVLGCRSVVMVPDPRLDSSFHGAADQVLGSLLNFNPSEWGLPPFEKVNNIDAHIHRHGTEMVKQLHLTRHIDRSSITSTYQLPPLERRHRPLSRNHSLSNSSLSLSSNQISGKGCGWWSGLWESGRIGMEEIGWREWGLVVGDEALEGGWVVREAVLKGGQVLTRGWRGMVAAMETEVDVSQSNDITVNPR